MDDLISKNVLIRNFRVRSNELLALYGEHDDYARGFDEAFDKVIDAPTVDAVPVVHGRWIENPDATHFCSVCGTDALWAQYNTNCYAERQTDICPHCGARMDLEV